MPNRANIKQRRVWCGINQDIEVTILGVLTTRNQTEDTRVAGAVGLYYETNRFSMGS